MIEVVRGYKIFFKFNNETHIHFDSSVSSHNTTSAHLPVSPALFHSPPKLAMVPHDARFLRFLEGEEADVIGAMSFLSMQPAEPYL